MAPKNGSIAYLPAEVGNLRSIGMAAFFYPLLPSYFF